MPRILAADQLACLPEFGGQCAVKVFHRGGVSEEISRRQSKEWIVNLAVLSNCDRAAVGRRLDDIGPLAAKREFIGRNPYNEFSRRIGFGDFKRDFPEFA